MLSGAALPVWGGGRQSLDHPRCLHPHPSTTTTTGAPQGVQTRLPPPPPRTGATSVAGTHVQRSGCRVQDAAAAAAAPLPKLRLHSDLPSSSPCRLLSLLFASAWQQKTQNNKSKNRNKYTTRQREVNRSVSFCLPERQMCCGLEACQAQRACRRGLPLLQ